MFAQSNNSTGSLDRHADISEGTISKSSQAKSYFEERYKKGGEKIKDGRKSYRLSMDDSRKLAESLEAGEGWFSTPPPAAASGMS